MCVCVLLSLLYVTCSSIIQEKSSAGQEQGEGQLEFLLFLLRLVPLWLFSVCFSNVLAILEVLATSPAPATFALSDLAFTEPPGSFFSCSVSGGVNFGQFTARVRLSFSLSYFNDQNFLLLGMESLYGISRRLALKKSCCSGLELGCPGGKCYF